MRVCKAAGLKVAEIGHLHAGRVERKRLGGDTDADDATRAPIPCFCNSCASIAADASSSEPRPATHNTGAPCQLGANSSEDRMGAGTPPALALDPAGGTSHRLSMTASIAPLILTRWS